MKSESLLSFILFIASFSFSSDLSDVEAFKFIHRFLAKRRKKEVAITVLGADLRRNITR